MQIDGHTRVFGILGHPTGHSLSPRIHNAAFAARKINAVYVPFDVPRAGAGLKRALRELPVPGLSVTIPHKAWAAKHADERDALSECCGAANTLIMRDGLMYAHNTDGAGALRALKQHVPDLRGRRFLLLGYGGSATAIAHSLLLDENPAMLAVGGRSATKITKFVKALKERHGRKATLIHGARPDLADLEPEQVDIIIHTTPLGMKGAPQELPLPEDFIQKFHHVFDIVYNPMRTVLLSHAASRGAQTIPGYLMLLYQAVIQFELFTGEAAPENLMEKELLAALRKRS